MINMSSSMSGINQKEYLKKYLGIGKLPGDKKKKKKDKTINARLKIIDDDIDDTLSQEIQEDISAANEDAPQIVAVIDDRPPSLRVDETTKSKLWKPIGEVVDSSSDIGLKIGSFQIRKPKTSDSLMADINKNKVKHYETVHRRKDKSTNIGKSTSKDFSPPKNKIKEVPSPRKYSENIKDYDFLPTKSRYEPSSSKTEDNSSRRKCEDISPPRRSENDSPKGKTNNLSPLRIKTEIDLSPPRKKYKDLSPVRKRNHSLDRQRSEDLSPPRKKDKQVNSSPPRKDYKNSSSSRRHEDLSPPRRKRKDDSPRNKSPVRIKREKSESPSRSSDLSPPRRSKYRDVSPELRNRMKETDGSSRQKFNDDFPRKIKQERSDSPCEKTDRDLSPQRKNKNKDLSPPRRYKNKDSSPQRRKARRNQSRSPPRERVSRWSNRSPDYTRKRSKTPEKARKTLSGKKSGLQNAKELIKEMVLLKEREEEVFRHMSEEISGKNAATIVRGQKPQDPEEEARKLKREAELKEKYDRWGKGLKQVQSENEKMLEQLNEMSKPLARYADDEDLERYLKEQEREGDPMLDYIRKKKKKKAVEAGVPEKPMYMGEFLPNRYSIRPGYRWDGVDRSNGYEKKWFQEYNTRKAIQEDAFKWSTEDM